MYIVCQHAHKQRDSFCRIRSSNIDEISNSIWQIINFSCESLSLAFCRRSSGIITWRVSGNSVWEVRKSHNRSFSFPLVLPRSVRVLQRTRTRDYDAPPPRRPGHVCSSMSGEAERSFLLQLQLDLLQTFIPVWVFPSPNMHYTKAFHPFISTLRRTLIFNSRSSIWNTSERTLLIKAQAGPASQ